MPLCDNNVYCRLLRSAITLMPLSLPTKTMLNIKDQVLNESVGDLSTRDLSKSKERVLRSLQKRRW